MDPMDRFNGKISTGNPMVFSLKKMGGVLQIVPSNSMIMRDYPLVITMNQYEPISSNLYQYQPILTKGKKWLRTIGIEKDHPV